MKNILSVSLFSLFFLFSCKSIHNQGVESIFVAIKIDTLLKDKISIRAISITNDKIYYAADKNRVGFLNLNDAGKMERNIKKDTLKIEFRSCAKTIDAFYVLSIANPALLYKFSSNLQSKKLVYEEQNKNVFYDSMQFYDAINGIAIGDPINGYLNVITTKDGGETWQKNSIENSPKVVDGEAAFAASNTNINIKNGKTWVITGGKKSRVFYSEDKGKSWRSFETPIVQGETMTGAFTADFYNDKIGFIAGGNYEKPNQNFQNKAITLNGGKTWKLVGENQGFGYSSCIQFVPESEGKQLVSVGANGLFYSFDSGKNWKQFSKESSFYTIRFLNKTTAIAAGKNKVVKITFQ